MVLSGVLGKSYNALESGFYKVMDFFEKRGIPVYNYNDFLESKGIPVFPFTIAIIAILLTAIGWFVFLSPHSVDVTLQLQDGAGNPLTGVQVRITDAQGKELFSGTVDNQEKITLNGVSANSQLEISATKTGFENAIDSIELNGTKTNFTLSLSERTAIITGLIQLVDEDTETIIRSAKVTATLPNGQSVIAIVESDGIARLNSIPSNSEIALKIEADHYELLQTSVLLQANQTKRISLTPGLGSSGKSRVLFQVFDDASKKLVPSSNIQILDAQTGSVISSVVASDGTFSFDLIPAKAYRYIVGAEDYATADSSLGEKNFTPRQKDESVSVFIHGGGSNVRVTVLSKSGQTAIPNSTVTLYNLFGEVLDGNGTGLGGSIEFRHLDSNQQYFVGAVAENYLPSSQIVNPLTDSDIALSLESVSADNSANVNVFVSDEENQPVSGATLQFFQESTGLFQPIGLPTQKTDIAGYFASSFPIGINLLARATKETSVGDGNVSVVPGNNEIKITVLAPSEIVSLNVLDELGNPVIGRVIVESVSGNVLFDENSIGTAISFDSLGNNVVRVKVTKADGKSFEEEINISGKNSVTVQAGFNESNQNAPQIKFLGIEGEDGSKQDGLVRGTESLLVFEVNFPKAAFSGLHFRVGNDSVKSAESQSIAITGLSADPTQFQYGRTYNAFPAPGSEGTDFQNMGSAGQSNQWVELYYNNAVGTKIVKVRVLERGGTQNNSEALHFRGWSRSGSAFYRNPNDAVLGTSEYSSQRGGLYAETTNPSLSVFDALPQCDNALCNSFLFLDDGGNEINPTDFKAVVGKVFALQSTIRAKSNLEAQLSASTSKENPNLSFTGSDVENFSVFPNGDEVKTSVGPLRVSANSGEVVRTRFYFKAINEGSAFIKTQSVSGSDSINKTFYFQSFSEKPLLVIINPKAVVAGEHFMARVSDNENNAIENATLTVLDAKGKVLESIVGTGSVNAGLSGFYKVANSFEPGTIKVQVKAPGYQFYETSVEISRNGIISLPPNIIISIPKDQTEQLQTIEVSNRSKEPIQEMQAEFVPDPAFPKTLSLDVDPLNAVLPKSKSNISLIAKFEGETERAHGEGTLIVTGKIAGQYSVTAQSRVSIEYNPVVSNDCLIFSVTQLSASLLNDVQSNKQLQFNAKNNCGIPIKLDAVIDGDTRKELLVNAESIQLEPKQEQPIQVTVSNALQRLGTGNRNYSLTIRYQSDSLSKSIPLKVSVISPRFSIQAPDIIHVYLAQSLVPGREFGDKRAKSVYPIYIRNTGTADITNLTVSQRNSSYSGVDLVVTNGDQGVDPFAFQNNQYGGSSLNNYQNQNNFFPNQFPNQYNSSLPLNLLSNTLSNQFPVLGGFNQLQNQFAYSPNNLSNAFVLGGGSVAAQPYYGYPRSSTTIPVLPRGQSVIPPLLLYATSDAQKSGDYLEQLAIEGTIDGKNVPLRNVNVFIHVSAPSCLKVGPKELSYSETDASQGVSGQIVTVTNSCSEDARITDIEPKSIGGNAISLLPANGFSAGVVPRNQKAKYQILVTKFQPTDTTQEVTLFAVLTQSGKYISTEPITLNLELGERAQKAQIVSVEKEIAYCENSNNKIKLKFPKIAQGTQADCSSAYCDAEQLSHYLAKRVDKKVQDAENAISQKNEEAINETCSMPNACLFSDLGVKEETVTVYLSNDNLSNELMQSIIDGDAYARIKGFNVQTSTISLDAIAGRGYGRQLLMAPIQGCGRYQITIRGAVESPSQKLQRGRETISLEIPVGRQDTPECRTEIQNFLNFLPQDSSLDYSNRKESWLGVVEQPNEKKLELISKEFSKSLFGKDSRVESGSVGTNSITLQLGALTARVVRVTIPKEAESNAPITMTATINETLFTIKSPTPNSNLPLTAAQEAGKAIRSFSSGNPSSGSCVSEDLSSIEIQSAVESSQISLNACGSGNGDNQNGSLHVSVGTLRGCDLNVSSPLNVSTKIEIKALEDEKNSINGLEEIPYILESIQSSTHVDSGTLFPLKKNNKTKQYDKGFKLVATGNDSIAQLFSDGAQVEVMATDSLGGSVTRTVSIQACGEHPYDLLAELNQQSIQLEKKKQQQFYSTLVWGGGKGSFKLGQLTAASSDGTVTGLKGALGDNIYYGTGIGLEAKRTQQGRDTLANQYYKALGLYAGVCIGTHLGADLVTGFLTAGVLPLLDAWGVALDCGIPFFAGLYQVAENQYPGGVPILSKVVENSWGYIRDGFSKLLNYSNISENKTSNTVTGPGEAALGAGIAETGLRALITRTLQYLNGFSTESKALEGYPTAHRQAFDGMVQASGEFQTINKETSTARSQVTKATKEIKDQKNVVALVDKQFNSTKNPKLADIYERRLAQERTILSQKEAIKLEANNKLSELTLKESAAAEKVKNAVNPLENSLTESQKKLDELLTTKKNTVNPKQLPDIQKEKVWVDDTLAKLKSTTKGSLGDEIQTIAKKAKPSGLGNQISAIAQSAPKAVAPEVNLTPGAKYKKLVQDRAKGLQFIRSITSGFVSNIAGFAAYNIMLNNQNQSNLVNVSDNCDLEFQKYHTYLFTINKNDKGAVTWDCQPWSKTAPDKSIVLESCDESKALRDLDDLPEPAPLVTAEGTPITPPEPAP